MAIVMLCHYEINQFQFEFNFKRHVQRFKCTFALILLRFSLNDFVVPQCFFVNAATWTSCLVLFVFTMSVKINFTFFGRPKMSKLLSWILNNCFKLLSRSVPYFRPCAILVIKGHYSNIILFMTSISISTYRNLNPKF